jgi:hypothetical protein
MGTISVIGSERPIGQSSITAFREAEGKACF